MKRFMKNPVFWMIVLTLGYSGMSVKLEYDRNNVKPSKQFEVMVDALYRGEKEYIRIHTTDGTDVTDVVLKSYQRAYQRQDYNTIYKGFQDTYVICYDPEHADLNP